MIQHIHTNHKTTNSCCSKALLHNEMFLANILSFLLLLCYELSQHVIVTPAIIVVPNASKRE